MAKLCTFCAALILVFAPLAKAENFPLLNNLYSYNCNGSADESTYWLKTADGKILKYSLDLDGTKLLHTRQAIEKYKIYDNKIILQLENKEKQVTQYDVLEVRPDGGNYRTIERLFGKDEFIKNGKFVGGNEDTRILNRCEPNTSVANLAIPKIRELLISDDPIKARGEIIKPRLVSNNSAVSKGPPPKKNSYPKISLSCAYDDRSNRRPIIFFYSPIDQISYFSQLESNGMPFDNKSTRLLPDSSFTENTYFFSETNYDQLRYHQQYGIDYVPDLIQINRKNLKISRTARSFLVLYDKQNKINLKREVHTYNYDCEILDAGIENKIIQYFLEGQRMDQEKRKLENDKEREKSKQPNKI